jgi:AcrR family transcriptional regulator
MATVLGDSSVGHAAAGSSQPERLIAALRLLVSESGYRDLSIAKLVERADVSRQTFRRHFGDRDACFLTAFGASADVLLEQVRLATRGEEPARAAAAACEAMVSFAAADPDAALLVFGESVRGSAPLREAGEQLLGAIAEIVGSAQGRAWRDIPVPDLPPRLTCGVAARLIVCRLRRRERVAELSRELGDWLALYEAPVGEHRWASLRAPAPADPSPFLPRRPLCPPPPPETGDRVVPTRSLADEDWLRIVFATAQVVDRDGYESARGGEIARLAGVELRTLQAAFDGQQQALAAAQELLFRHLMAVTAGAFVTGETWPVRLWEAARALTQCAEQNSRLSRVSLLEPCLAGTSGDRLPQDVTSAFAMFLREGELDADRSSSSAAISDTVLGAIVTAVFDLAFQHVGGDPGAPLTDLFARVVFICTTPFLGPADAAVLARRGKAPERTVDPHQPRRRAQTTDNRPSAA